MGMSDKQFDSYKALLLQMLRDAVRRGEEKEVIQSLIERLEAELTSP